MAGDHIWLRYILAALATWRLTHLLALEDGPWDIVARLRRLAGTGLLGRMMDCFNCLSIWIAAGITLIIQPGWKDCWVAWLGLSGAACLLNRIGHDPVVMQTIDEGGTDNALLRSESGASEDGGEGADIAHGGS